MKNLTKKFEFTENLHEFERIRAIWENILESFKIIQIQAVAIWAFWAFEPFGHLGISTGQGLFPK